MAKIELPNPTLVFVAGGPCTGKTTLLNRLLPQLDRVILIDKDDIGDCFLRTPNGDATGGEYNISWYKLNGPRHSISSEFYRDNLQKQTYLAMLEVAATNIGLGLSAFLQGNYTTQIKEGYFPEIVNPFLVQKGIHVPVKLLLCFADPEVIKERIRKRNNPRDASKLGSKEAMDKYIAAQDFVPERVNELDHIKLDSTAYSVEDNLRRAIEYLLR